LDEARAALARVGAQLSDAKAKLEQFMNAPLTGQAAFEDAMFNAEKAINQLQLAIINFKLGNGLSAARERVDSIRDALEEARAEYDRFANATLEGSKAYSDALFANEMATKQLQLQLANIKSEALKKAADIAKQFDERIQSNKDRIIALNASIQSIKDGALAKVNDRVDKLKADITSAHAAFDKFVNAQLVGSKEYEDQLFANEQAIAKVKLAINELKQAQAGSEGNSALAALQNQLDQIEIRRKELQAQLLDLTTAGATKDSPAIKALEKSMDEAALAALNTQIAIDKINASGGDDNAAMEALLKQLDQLQLAGENIDLKKQLDLDPQYRKLKEITQTQEELTFADAIAGAEAAKAQINLFGGELTAAESEQAGLNAQIAEMEKLIKGITSETDKLELDKKLAVDAAWPRLKLLKIKLLSWPLKLRRLGSGNSLI